ncbi:MAG: hypothetical protein ABJ139_04935, partial [Paracoccaceae bacterium]
MTNAWHLFEYVAYAFATKKLRSATIESHLSAIKFFHRISRGFELDITHPVLGNVLKGAVRSHADAGNQATGFVGNVDGGRETDIYVADGGSRLVACPLRFIFFLTRASEMFAETRSRVHETCCLRRADVAFFRGK